MLRISLWIRLGATEVPHPAGAPELDHFLGGPAKVPNTRHAADELGRHLAAQDSPAR